MQRVRCKTDGVSYPDYLGAPADLPGRAERARPARIREFKYAEWLAVTAVCLGAVMSQIDNGVITVAYPTLVEKLHRPLSEVVWIGLAPFVVMVATLLLFGRRADTLGRKRVYVDGFVIFLIGDFAAAATAHHFALLVIARSVSALGVAMVQANSVALITASVREHQRTTALGIQAASQAIGLAIGPFVGGLLIGHMPYRFIFLISAPVAFAALVASVLFLPRTRSVLERAPLDIAGSLVLALASAGLLGGLTLAAKTGWNGPTLGFIAIGISATMALFGVERHAKAPIFSPRLFKLVKVRFSIALLVLTYISFFGLLVSIPFFVKKDFGASVVHASEATMAIPIGLAIMAPLSGFVRRRISAGWLQRLSMTTIALALVGISVAPNGKIVAGLLILIGLAIGVANTTNNAAIMEGVHLDDRGLASGTLNLARAAGSAIGMAVATSAMVVLEHSHASSNRAAIATLVLPAGVAVIVAIFASRRP